MAVSVVGADEAGVAATGVVRIVVAGAVVERGGVFGAGVAVAEATDVARPRVNASKEGEATAPTVAADAVGAARADDSNAASRIFFMFFLNIPFEQGKLSNLIRI